MKVIIMGAGIAGLTLAAACQHVGIQTKIYDKATQLSNIGGGLLLWPYAMRYLEWLGLSDCIKPYRVAVKGCNIVNHVGQKIFSEDYASLYSLIGGEILPIDRNLLQQTLLAQLSNHTLTLGKTCVDIKNEPHAAQVIFSDGTQDSADLIVGADGIHSIVRKSFNKHAVVQYTDHCWWGGMIEQKYVPQLPPNEVFVAVGLGKMCITWPTCGNRFMWYLPVKMPLSDFCHGADGVTQLKKMCANWSEEVQQIICAPASAQRFHLPIYTLLPQSNWSTSRITLIGDAAHALGPILGQGANQGIEDAFVLVRCLQKSLGSIDATLSCYEMLRHKKAYRLFELENQSAATMINDDLEALEIFQQQIQHLNLATFYQDLIPLVDEKSCSELASAININWQNSSMAVDYPKQHPHHGLI